MSVEKRDTKQKSPMQKAMKGLWMIQGLWIASLLLSLVFTSVTALSVADFLSVLFGSATPTMSHATPFMQFQQRLYAPLMSNGPQAALWRYALLMLVVYTAKNVASYLSAVSGARVRLGVVGALRSAMHERFLHWPIAKWQSTSRGDLLSRMGNDLVELEETLLTANQSLVASVLAVVFYFVTLWLVSPRLTCVLLALMPGLALGLNWIGRKLKKKSQHVQEVHGQLMAQVEQTMVAQREVKSHNAGAYMRRKFREMNESYTRERIQMFRRIYSASPISDTLGNLMVALLLLYAGSQILLSEPTLSTTALVTHLMVTVMIIPHIKEIGTALTNRKRGKACKDRIEEWLAEPTDPLATDETEDKEKHPTKIEVKHLNFAYGEQPILRDVSFTWNKGQVLALVGESGSGKSTLAQLLALRYPHEAGSIEVDGKPLAEWSPADWRKKVGMVGQNAMMFHQTVAENVSMGRERIGEKKIREVLRQACAEQFVDAMPEGMETSMGDEGSRVSGGQKQRIAIARALAGDPEILIFDEATSALDSATEDQLLKNLKQTSQDCMVLWVAHRLSTLRLADQILVLHEGSVVEQGTHKELLEQGGRYARLYALQQTERQEGGENEK